MAMFVRTVRANHDETVEIQWRLADGSAYVERHTMPPAAVRAARTATTVQEPADQAATASSALAEIVARNAAGQVVDRLKANAAGQRYMLPPPGK